ncbi:hypothetical protein ILUMI_00995 [Ignelater luminosus]|uniref:SH3 domain-containing protein n=1 Tax=Ignelater luminosus TaxID=2038154 RepID=A0A8K0DRK7_IGNLU|nr:hypothetical protein ILUMI_00995 [Ignelater luminosus]
MKSMRIPTRPAPSVEDALHKRSTNQRSNQQNVKKKPPPRPPPPNLNKVKSKSAWNLNQQFEDVSLIDLSPPQSPKNFVANRNRAFGGSVSSSFSSSTSSLASSKKSFEYETVNVDPWALAPPTNTNVPQQSTFYLGSNLNNTPIVPQISVPTIIRAQPNKRNQIKTKQEPFERENSPPMPAVPPPSPPKEVSEVTVPYGIALYDFPGAHDDDLRLQENDVVFLLRRINNEWFYGRVEEREGMFPTNFVSVQVPLPEDDRVVTALYEFIPQVAGDLALKPGQIVRVTGRTSADWLTGESEGRMGQFPANFIDRIPSTL